MFAPPTSSTLAFRLNFRAMSRSFANSQTCEMDETGSLAHPAELPHPPVDAELVDFHGETSQLERQQPRGPTRPRLPVRPGEHFGGADLTVALDR
jgi:hypothetical protein